MIITSKDFKSAIYSQRRQFDSRVTIGMNDGSQPTVYDDTYILNFHCVNELSVVNDSLSSDQLQLTLKNEDGRFNFFGLQNMQEILARNPYIIPELGLVTSWDSNGLPATNEWVKLGTFYITEWKNDKDAFTVTLTAHDNMLNLANTTYLASSGLKTGTLYDLACDVLITAGFQVTNKKGYRYIRETMSGNSYNATNAMTEFELIDVNGTNVVAGLIPTSSSAPTTGDLSMITDGDKESVDYTVVGTGSADWIKFDLGVTHYDLSSINVWHFWGDPRIYAFTIEGSMDGTTWETIYSQDKVTGVTEGTNGIHIELKPLANVDDGLKNITNKGFTKDLSVRDALQNIGLASMSAVYQDRYGVVKVKPFEAIQEVTPAWINYSGTEWQDALGWDGSGTIFQPLYPEQAIDSMLDLNLDTQYKVPQISLAQNVYQIQISVYDGLGENGSPTSYVFVNPNIVGVNGDSFQIDDPLITTQAMAKTVSDWYFKEMSYNALYQCDWRQNPALEVADLVIIEDGFNTARQARIYRQEFQYDGALKGITESRGGI